MIKCEELYECSLRFSEPPLETLEKNLSYRELRESLERKLINDLITDEKVIYTT